MMSDYVVISGTVRQGLRIGSGLAERPKMTPYGALNDCIRKQKPFFERSGVPNISQMYNGTINLDISPKKFQITNPDYEVKDCEWHPRLKESFWFVAGEAIFKGQGYEGYIYYPCPSEVKSHPDNLVEILSQKIPDLNYGDSLIFRTSNNKVQLY